MIKFTTSGSTKRTQKFLREMQKANPFSEIHSIARRGVAALQAATPARTGLTASSWYYEIENKDGKLTISFLNSNNQNGVNVAVLLQYGHATGTGGYVSGIDYINPALRPIFDEIADEVWKKVTSA